MIHIGPKALAQATPEQIAAICRLHNERINVLDVGPATFDLPDRYLCFRQDYKDGSVSIYGGIDTDGSVST